MNKKNKKKEKKKDSGDDVTADSCMDIDQMAVTPSRLVLCRAVPNDIFYKTQSDGIHTGQELFPITKGARKYI